MNRFDKIDAFPFSIVRIPQLTSNVPSKILYAAYGTECVKTNFINHCSTLLISKMINKGGNVNTISKTLSKKFCRYFETFSKFFTKSLELAESIST